jgi:hypothetical protein
MIVASSVAVLAEVWGELLRTAGATERLMGLLAARSPIADPPHPRVLPAVRGTQPLRSSLIRSACRCATSLSPSITPNNAFTSGVRSASGIGGIEKRGFINRYKAPQPNAL